MNDQQLQQREQVLYQEGMWTSGIISNFSAKETYNLSPTKQALFHALYKGPIWHLPIQWIIDILRSITFWTVKRSMSHM